MGEEQARASTLRFITVKEVVAKIGMSRSTVYEKIRSDPTFPKKVKVGPGGKNVAVRFVESEINEWMALQVQAGRPTLPKVRNASDATPKTETTASKPGIDDLTAAKQSLASEYFTTLSTLLEKNAQIGKCISYAEAMAPLRLWEDVAEDREIFENLLERISIASHTAGKGLLGVLIHEKTGRTGRPGPAFFKMADKLGYTYEDGTAFVDHEIKRLYLLHEDPNYPRKTGKLMWIEHRGKRTLMRVEHLRA